MYNRIRCQCPKYFPVPFSPCHETRPAAELSEELLLAQPVGLDHLAEYFIRVVAGGVRDARPAH